MGLYGSSRNLYLWLIVTAGCVNIKITKILNHLKWKYKYVQVLLVISPKMTCKTGQMSVRPYGVNIFKTSRLRDRWADVDQTVQVYSMDRGHKFEEAEFYISAPAPSGRDDPPRAGWLVLCADIVVSTYSWLWELRLRWRRRIPADRPPCTSESCRSFPVPVATSRIRGGRSRVAEWVRVRAGPGAGPRTARTARWCHEWRRAWRRWRWRSARRRWPPTWHRRCPTARTAVASARRGCRYDTRRPRTAIRSADKRHRSALHRIRMYTSSTSRKTTRLALQV